MMVHVLSVLAFVVVTFAVQATSHFVLNKAHYDGVGILRGDIIMSLGLVTMIVQGLIMSIALHMWRKGDVAIWDGMTVSLAFGLFLGTYISLTEAAKYQVPSVTDWIRVEALSSSLQFVAFGLLLGLIHRQFAS